MDDLLEIIPAELNPMFHIFKSIFPALAMAFFLNACAAAVNWDYPRMPSKAFANPETTSVGALFQEAADKHPGLSGFSLVEHGENAFLARLAMADLAEKTWTRSITSGIRTPPAGS